LFLKDFSIIRGLYIARTLKNFKNFIFPQIHANKKTKENTVRETRKEREKSFCF